MGTYQNSLEAVENEMKGTVDALYSAYLGKLEDNRQFLPDLKAKRAHEATSEYIAASTAAKERCLAKEAPLFADLRRDVEKALAAAPSQGQLAYLQTLSLRSTLTESDIVTAAVAVAGNAAAEANVAELAKREGIISAKVTAPPALPDLLASIDKWEETRQQRVINYRTVQQDGQVSGEPEFGFIPGGGWSKTMEEAEGAIERYGAK